MFSRNFFKRISTFSTLIYPNKPAYSSILSFHEDNNTYYKPIKQFHILQSLPYSTITPLSLIEYEQLAEETLNSLTESFDSLPASTNCPTQYDVNFSDGVLTIFISDEVGTYVINKQTPNRQIWLSSPMSGPKRFDLVEGKWMYTHEDVCLHDLLESEFSAILKSKIDFKKLDHL